MSDERTQIARMLRSSTPKPSRGDASVMTATAERAATLVSASQSRYGTVKRTVAQPCDIPAFGRVGFAVSAQESSRRDASVMTRTPAACEAEAMLSLKESSDPVRRSHRGGLRLPGARRPRRSLRYLACTCQVHRPVVVVRGAGALRALRVALDFAPPAPRRPAGLRALASRILAHLGRARLDRWRLGRGWLVDGERLRRRDAVRRRHLEPGGCSVGRPGAVRELAVIDRRAASGRADSRGLVHRAAGRVVVAGMAADVAGVRVAVTAW